MVVQYKCKCLNVTLDLEAAPQETDEVMWLKQYTSISSFGRGELGVGGVRTEVDKLVTQKVISNVRQRWKCLTCNNCGLDICAIQATNTTHPVINMSLLPKSEFEDLTQSKDYSPVFHIIVKDNEEALHSFIHPPDQATAEVLQKINKQTEDYTRREEDAMNERIKKYTDEQKEIFSLVQSRAERDRKLLSYKLTRSAHAPLPTGNFSLGSSALGSSSTKVPVSPEKGQSQSQSPHLGQGPPVLGRSLSSHPVLRDLPQSQGVGGGINSPQASVAGSVGVASSTPSGVSASVLRKGSQAQAQAQVPPISPTTSRAGTAAAKGMPRSSFTPSLIPSKNLSSSVMPPTFSGPSISPRGTFTAGGATPNTNAIANSLRGTSQHPPSVLRTSNPNVPNTDSSVSSNTFSPTISTTSVSTTTTISAGATTISSSVPVRVGLEKSLGFQLDPPKSLLALSSSYSPANDLKGGEGFDKVAVFSFEDEEDKEDEASSKEDENDSEEEDKDDDGEEPRPSHLHAPSMGIPMGSSFAYVNNNLSNAERLYGSSVPIAIPLSVLVRAPPKDAGTLEDAKTPHELAKGDKQTSDLSKSFAVPLSMTRRIKGYI
eukprot:TRINITY_DN1649_c0_g1_i1.p1 TRINITY_DN1649_c0_g1~~TRINITY_DN1649_c0_g1_i1.p1  ORF type:complete len:601 (-),score=109.73 TRINITY_DN1649_c0_g1_i1:44-1846(-)